MMKIFVIPLSFIFITWQANSVELEEPLSAYVNDVCQYKLLEYCNKTPQLISFLTIYAENFEGYMQSEDKNEVRRLFNQHHIARLCIEDLYPKHSDEITAKMKAYMIYSKERFHLFIKSEGKLSDIGVQLPEITYENTTEYCNSLI
ncbi:hypothetical protein Q4561_13915 [Alteromonas sp. 1_MG-2023]|uniref:hypothetical protein n=1 Tax=Alteromonas sp. 1_MG-2023 TaxID=3062669 RepID=UPI0026E24101|nr:hypothetical protein [Alteromonas sp. 1_MG-2023]MDO6568164.1 hypothetical protein [Alteromonas sp. 1_MG-2023]